MPPACLAAAQNGAYFTQGAAEILPGGVELRVADLPPSPIICQKVDPTVLSFDNKSLLSRSYDKTTLTLEGSCRSARDCIVEKWFACVASVPLNVIQPNHMLRAGTDVKLSDVTASRT